jgi:hypothetical protein
MTDIQYILAEIAREHLGMTTLTSPDSHLGNVTVGQLRAAMQAAYEQGVRATLIRRLRITHVVHARQCERFPWQVFRNDAKGQVRCHLLGSDCREHAAIRSRYRAADDRPLAVPLTEISLPVLRKLESVLAEEASSSD